MLTRRGLFGVVAGAVAAVFGVVARPRVWTFGESRRVVPLHTLSEAEMARWYDFDAAVKSLSDEIDRRAVDECMARYTVAVEAGDDMVSARHADMVFLAGDQWGQ